MNADFSSLVLTFFVFILFPFSSIIPSLYAGVLLKGVTNSFINLNAIKASIALPIKSVLTFP